MKKKPGPKVFSYNGAMKKCNCPLHNGQFVPIDQFWVFKTGKRAGKPMSKCIDGWKLSKGLDPGRSGYVPLSRVKFIFHELEARIGKTETCRRLGISQNFWMRMERGITRQARKETVIKAMELLRECRAHDEVRHRYSIRHGAAARGRKERPKPKHRKEFNVQKFQNESEMRNQHRKRAEDQGLTSEAA